MTTTHRISKSRFMAGLQCHKLLWLKVHEPDAKELQPDKVLNDLFDQGREVGRMATTRFPGGVAIDLPHHAVEERLSATKDALDAGAPCIYEASFIADKTFVAVDILERMDDGFRLIEVKSSSSQKDEHVPDAAVQRHVLAPCGIDVKSVEIMHLNREFRHPDEGDLFARTDVTTPVDALIADIPPEMNRQIEMLGGPCPDVPIGIHCSAPRDCPFINRCWPDSPNHISNLYLVGPKSAASYLQQGIHWISDLPPGKKLNFTAKRQMKAMAENRMIVEPKLRDALAPFEGRLGFLDFETIVRAVPVWPGMKPWQQAAAQYSYHEQNDDGTHSHAAFLAEGPQDARPLLAASMVSATAQADLVVTYSSFEKTRIRELQEVVPHLRAELETLEGKLIDLLPVVRNHVYHPDFRGSFSLKYILTPLVPELTYDDLVIVDGRVASVEIARLLFVAGKIPPDQQAKTRKDLLDYCERDTWAMVKLLERLRELAGM